MTAINASVSLPAISAPGPASAAPETDEAPFSFHDLLEIVNPLQHIPVVSTLYRWITGDKIPTADKIIGDAIYGGPTGFFASVADTIFETATGKDVGDTVLAWFTGGDDDKTDVASAAPAQAAPAPSTLISSLAAPTPDLSALLQSLADKGVEPATARRAAFAYGRSLSLSALQPLN